MTDHPLALAGLAFAAGYLGGRLARWVDGDDAARWRMAVRAIDLIERRLARLDSDCADHVDQINAIHARINRVESRKIEATIHRGRN